MSEARRVITEDVAVSELPEKVRGSFSADEVVRVTLEQQPKSLEEGEEPAYLKFAGIGAYMNTSIEEAVARVRALRDDDD